MPARPVKDISMSSSLSPSSRSIAGAESSRSELLDVRQIAQLLSASPRTIYRLADTGKMPRPVKLGVLVRWRSIEIEQWIAAGCPSCRKAKRAGGIK